MAAMLLRLLLGFEARPYSISRHIIITQHVSKLRLELMRCDTMRCYAMRWSLERQTDSAQAHTRHMPTWAHKHEQTRCSCD